MPRTSSVFSHVHGVKRIAILALILTSLFAAAETRSQSVAGDQQPKSYPLSPGDPAARLDPALLNVRPISPPARAKDIVQLPPDVSEKVVVYDQGMKSVSYPGEGLSTLSTSPPDASDEPQPDIIDPQVVVGGDDRVRVTDTTAYPYKTMVKLFIQFPGDAGRGGCTGTLIGKKHVLTAGHCIYDTVRNVWASSIEVVPGLNGTYKPYGSAFSIKLRTVDRWINDDDPAYDYGLITLDREIGTYTSWLLPEFLPEPNGTVSRISGYPADDPNSSGDDNCKDPSDAQTGLRQCFGTGTIDSSSDLVVYYSIDTFGGQSGSAVFLIESGTARVFAVHHGGNETTGIGNQATRITVNRRDAINTWIAEDAPSYRGYLDYADCNSIAGWAQDAKNRNVMLAVEVYDGAALVATANADQARSDLTAAGIGNRAFSIPTPAALKNGRAHSLSVRVKGSTFTLSGSPKSVTCQAPPIYEGYHDQADCNFISGWAWDKNRPTERVNVDILSDGVLLATVTADQFRQDLKNAGKGDGLHGFSIPTPAGLKNNQAHSIRVRFANTSTSLTRSPKTLSCSTTPPPPNYTGYVDFANCDSIGGWAADKNRPGSSINVSLYEGATLLATVPANQARPDVGSFLKDNGLHGFNIPIPAGLKNGQPHTLSVRFESSSANLNNSPKTVTCSGAPPPPTSPAYEGYHDFVNCNSIAGWVRDRNNPATRLGVSVYDDATGALIATGTADQFRQDLSNAGKGDGKYGFFIPTPAGLKDGQNHPVRVRVTGTNFSLSNTPNNFNSSTSCPPPSTVDLVVTAVSGTSNVTTGGTIDISATTLNQGNASAGGFRLGLYFSTNASISTSDTFIGSCDHGGLSAGSSVTCSGPLTVPQTLAPGTYYLGAIADYQNSVAESSEANNARASSAINVSSTVPSIGWEFGGNGNFEGWAAVNASASAVNGGTLLIDPSGSDPHITSPTLSANASSYKFVVVRIASNGLDPFGNIYFKTQAENFYSADKRVEFTVQNCALCGNASFITYTINMTANSKWAGTITGIRIDPANDGKAATNTDSMGFDFIRLTPN